MKQAKTTTYTIQATNDSPHGLNQTYYFRTEAEANRRLADLKEWYKNIPTQKFSTSSHQIQTN